MTGTYVASWRREGCPMRRREWLIVDEVAAWFFVLSVVFLCFVL